MLQKFIAAVVSEEWARECCEIFPSSCQTIFATSPLAKEISTKALAWLQGDPPPAYHEMALTLHRIHADCASLLHLFVSDCKLPVSSIPFLGNEIDITGTKPGSFTIETAKAATGPMYTRLRDSLGRTKKKELAFIAEKHSAVAASIDRYKEVKMQHDTRVAASFASAFVAFRSTPDKVSPVVKGIMNGIKVAQHICADFLLTVASERGEL